MNSLLFITLLCKPALQCLQSVIQFLETCAPCKVCPPEATKVHMVEQKEVPEAEISICRPTCTVVSSFGNVVVQAVQHLEV